MDTTADGAGRLEQMPRFADGSVNLQRLFRSLAERIVDEVMARVNENAKRMLEAAVEHADRVEEKQDDVVIQRL